MHRGQFSVSFLVFLIAGLCCLAFIGGCAKKEVKVGEETPLPTEQITTPTTPQEVPSAEEQGIGEEALAGQLGMGQEQAAGEEEFGAKISEGRTSAPMLPIYFDFDKYNIRDDMKERIEQNARFLLDHPDVRIQIQGNCDERGTNEYNLALGERRAKSAKAYLVNLGVSPDRIETISFGEERPLDPRHCKDAWAKNRRDDFVIIR